MKKKKINFKPLRDWILLPDPRKTETDSGIILGDNIQKEISTNVLKVLAVGPEAKWVKEGDTVMIDPTITGMIISIDDKTHVLVAEFHCLGIMDSETLVWDKNHAEFAPSK
jgi:co-chaperonin GroES (HSP10)|tara:strand:- start:4444 stop:4776 length:333 start_codon:yes stop_codon:yes gene_type:complete